MLRVCHLITSLATGGAETALFRLVTATDRMKQEQVVISLTDEGVYGPRLREAGIAAGVSPILVETGYGDKERMLVKGKVTCVRDLRSAVACIAPEFAICANK